MAGKHWCTESEIETMSCPYSQDTSPIDTVLHLEAHVWRSSVLCSSKAVKRKEEEGRISGSGEARRVIFFSLSFFLALGCLSE